MNDPSAMPPCPRDVCSGSIKATGYCNRCGLSAPVIGRPRRRRPTTPGRRIMSLQDDAPAGQITNPRSRVGAGVTHVEPQPASDAAAGTSAAPIPGPQRFREGEVVARQYEVLRELNHGGMGWVCQVRDLNVSDRICVLKGIIAPRNQAAAEAAEAEREALARLSHHANIVTIYNFVNHEDQGYIVMEYLGGLTLRQKWEAYRARHRGFVPVTEAISCVLGVLPAISYMHRHNRMYCDFKPDNIMHVEDEVKLIDLGAVYRIDEPNPDVPVFGTLGYQADEVPETLPTVASDVFSIGRTLAVLILDWPQWSALDSNERLVEVVPEREEHDLLVQHDCLWRFLQRACAPEPAARFVDVDEMADQLYGVLCEVTATEERRRMPAYQSTRWGQPRPTLDPLDWRSLPRPILPDHATHPDRLAGTAEGDAAIQVVEQLAADEPLSWADCATAAAAYCERARQADLDRAEELVERLDPGEGDPDGDPEGAAEAAGGSAGQAATIRAARHYLRGIIELARLAGLRNRTGRSERLRAVVEEAVSRFDAAYAAAPGEAACALAYATALEVAADLERHLRRSDLEAGPEGAVTTPYRKVAGLYDQVVMAYRSWTGATAGLSRALDATGEHEPTAVARVALKVPDGHPMRAEALTLACDHMRRHACFDDEVVDKVLAHLDGAEAGSRSVAAATLEAALYQAGLAALAAEQPVRSDVVGRRAADGGAVEQAPATAVELRQRAEGALRELARVTPDLAHRPQLLDEAARIRPWTWH